MPPIHTRLGQSKYENRHPSNYFELSAVRLRINMAGNSLSRRWANEYRRAAKAEKISEANRLLLALIPSGVHGGVEEGICQECSMALELQNTENDTKC